MAAVSQKTYGTKFSLFWWGHLQVKDEFTCNKKLHCSWFPPHDLILTFRERLGLCHLCDNAHGKKNFKMPLQTTFIITMPCLGHEAWEQLYSVVCSFFVGSEANLNLCILFPWIHSWSTHGRPATTHWVLAGLACGMHPETWVGITR